MKPSLTTLKKQLSPFRSAISFVFWLFLFWFAWEALVDGQLFFIHFPWEIPSEQLRDSYLFFLGKNVTPDWLLSVCRWLTAAAGWVARLIPGNDDLIVGDIFLTYPANEGWRISIVVGCTGIKQLTIFSCILLFYRNWPMKKYQWNKLWYIPLGCVILTVYNVLRIAIVVIFTNGHPERFEWLHDGVLRCVYYALIFILWVIWEEKFVRKETK